MNYFQQFARPTVGFVTNYFRARLLLIEMKTINMTSKLFKRNGKDGQRRRLASGHIESKGEIRYMRPDAARAAGQWAIKKYSKAFRKLAQ